MSDNTKATIRRIVEAVWRGASAAFGPDLVSWEGLDLEAREQLITQATGQLIDAGLAALAEENHRLREALGVKERMSPHTLNAPLPEVLEAHFPAAEWLLSTDPDTVPKDVWTREMTSVWLLLQRLRFEVEKVQPRPVPEGQPIEPDENLRQQIEAAKAIEALGEDPALYHAESVAQHGAPLAKLVLDLDTYLAAGGVPPERWGCSPCHGRMARARIATLESERDEALKAYCEAQHESEQTASDERGGPVRAAREIAVEEYGEEVAARLFDPPHNPVEVPK